MASSAVPTTIEPGQNLNCDFMVRAKEGGDLPTPSAIMRHIEALAEELGVEITGFSVRNW